MPEPQPGVTEEIDPFAFGDEFASPPKGVSSTVPEEKRVSETARKEDRVAVAAPVVKSDSTVSARTAGGVIYRVQIGIFEEQRSAERYAEEARGKVDRNVYIEFEPPFFRVRVGDFTTRKEADEYVRILQDYGFRGSFWIMKNAKTP